MLHTLNIRLFPEQLTYIANHAEDEVVFADRSLVALLWPLVGTFETVRHYVVMDDGKGDVPDDPRILHYEDLLAAAEPVDFDVRAATGTPILQAWGMTETSPVASVCRVKSTLRDSAEGYIRLVDRTKDLVKSGGEWISSVELENEIMAHPKVAEAAVIGVPHERWVERPLACVVVKPGENLTKAEVIEFLGPRVAKWWLPDDVVFIDEVPKTSVGKFSKKTLRDRFADHRLPTS